MNPMIHLLNLIARAVDHARAVFARGDRAETQRALAAADEMARGAVADALADQKRRRPLHEIPFSNN